MKNELYILWKENQSAKDFLNAKQYEYAKQESDEKIDLWRYRIEK
jgi:hypothetical protein